MAGEYRIRFMGDLGNLSQFTSGIVGSASSIKNAFRTAAASPVTSLKAPGLNITNLTTTVDAANRVLIQSGTVFHRTVAGWTADLAKLDAATTRSARTQGQIGLGGTAFRTPTGPSVFGTSYGSTKGGRLPTAGVYARDLKPVYDTFAEGEFKQIMGDLDKINAATRALIPATTELAAIDKKAALEFYRYEATRLTLIQAQTAAIREQAAAKVALERAYKIGGGVAPRFDSTGAMIAPGKLIADPKEYAKIARSPAYEALRASPGAGVMIGGTLKTKLSAADMKALVMQDVAAASMGMVTQGNLELGIRQVRGIDLIEKSITDRNVVLKKIEGQLKAANVKQEAFNKKIEGQKKAVRQKYATEYQALDEAKVTPAVPYQMNELLRTSKSLRRQVTKQLGITAPYGTADFAKQFNEKVASVNVSKDLTRGITNIGMEAKGADGILGRMTVGLNQQGQIIEKWSGSFRNAGSTLKMIAVDFKKVLEWTVATTLVFGAFGAAIGSVSKVNQVTNDLQRFQIVAKTTGEETKVAFNTIADVAYRTATPLMELTAVMDDIALATRKVGQTSAEWATDMQYLANAVGIFTNIAGVDTVKATDQLSAAFKQLQVNPDQLITILNKVTAVAGGNAQAVTDIVSAIGTVAEAAKAAGFDIDEQIAAVQVLSQVTNKSAADLATSFKNLFGSLNAPASVKVLKSFGIEVRDATGNLRPFLDVYKEIYEAIQQGVIPEGRVQDVLRAISGGPRRAPDAAAILGNLPKIFETIDKSVSATNEALIANAKILSTNSAKLQQLRTAFDTAVINTFTEAVNKLVVGITDLGKIFTTVLGSGASSSIASSIIQFGALIAIITLAVKALGGMRTVLMGLAADLKVVNIQSKASGLLFGNATQIRPNVYKTGIDLAKSERPGFAKYKTLDGKWEYWPIVPGAAPPKPDPLKLGPQRLQGISERWQTSRGLRFGTATMGGAAGALALGGIGALTGNALPSQIGTSLGMLGLMSMNPLGMAAGATAIAVSQLFQIWQEGIERTKEKQRILQVSIYDQIKSLQESQRAYETVKEIQDNAQKTIEELGMKTSLTTDETERLTEAQNTYATSTIDVMKAERSLLDSRGKLLDQLPQLEKYKDLAAKAMSLNPDDLQMLVERLAKDIIAASGTYVPSYGPMYKEAFTPQLKPGQTGIQAPVTSNILGASTYRRPENAKLASTEGIIEALRQGGVEAAVSFLNNPKAFTGGKGVEVTPELASTIETLLSLTTEEERANIEGFENAVKVFEESVLTLQGSTDGYKQMQINMAGFKSRTQANIAFGIGDSTENQNAAGRQKIGDLLLDYAKRLAETPTPSMRGEGQNYPGSSLGQRDINNILYGEGGFVSTGTKENTLAITAEEAKKLFDVIAQLDPALADVNKNAAEYGQIVYSYFKDVGIEIDGLLTKEQQLAEDFADLREQIDQSVKSGQQALYDELVTLQAQKQGGEFKDNPAVFTAEVDQVNALINAYKELGSAFSANVDILPVLQEQLGQVKVLQGLLFTDVNNLLPALLNIANTMGMTGPQIDTLTNSVVRLIAALSAVASIPTIVKQIRVEIQTAMVSGNARRRGQEGGLIGLRTTDYNNILQANSTRDIQKIINDIQKQFNNALGSGFNQTTSSGGGGGGSSRQIGNLDLPDEWKSIDYKAKIKEAVAWAKKYQRAIPGETSKNRNDLVAVMLGNTRVLLQRGIGEEYLRKAIDKLTDEIKKQNDLLAKADTISRIRVGAGDFAALANVPMNSKTGISIGGPSQPISVNLNVNGQILTPAQLTQLANAIAAQIKKSYSA